MAQGIRWALIGASRIAAGQMIRAFREAGGEVTAVLSSDADRGRAYAEEHGIPAAFTDLDAMLADAPCDAVYISTTNEKHLDQALAAIAAGKHVLCEKPLALTVADAATMVRAADAAGLVFATNHHLRTYAPQMAVRKLVEEGTLGTILSARVFHAVSLPEALRGWRITEPGAGGGVIPDITVHDADTVRFILGEDPMEVVAQSTTSGLGQGVEDSAMSVWSMPSGAMVMTHESFTHSHARTGLELHGTAGSVVARNVMNVMEPNPEIKLTDAQGTRPVTFEPNDAYTAAMQVFTKAVREGTRPSADGADGVKSLAVALAVRQAALTGRAAQPEYAGF